MEDLPIKAFCHDCKIAGVGGDKREAWYFMIHFSEPKPKQPYDKRATRITGQATPDLPGRCH